MATVPIPQRYHSLVLSLYCVCHLGCGHDSCLFPAKIKFKLLSLLVKPLHKEGVTLNYQRLRYDLVYLWAEQL